MSTAVIGIAALLVAAVLAFSTYRYGMFFDVNFYKLEWIIIAAALLSPVLLRLVRRSGGSGDEGEADGEASPVRDSGDGVSRCITTDGCREQLPARGISLYDGGRSAACNEDSGQASARSKGIRAALRRNWRAFTGSGFVRTVPLAAYSPLALALLYAVSLINGPASVLGTIEQALRWSAYCAFLLAAYIWFGEERSRVWLSGAIQAAGVFIVWGALACWMGWLSFPEMIMTTGDARLSAVGARLAGFVQYPNAFAAIAGAYLVWCWLLLVRVRTFLSSMLIAAQATPLALVLLLTESRAAWLAAGVGWLAGLLVIGRQERIPWLLYSGWTLAAAGAAYRFVYGAGLRNGRLEALEMAPQAVFSEGVLLLSIVLAGVIGCIGIRALAARISGRWSELVAWGGWAAAIAAMALLLPAAIQGRLGGYFETLGARSMFYKDAFILIREAPLLGRGGDTWRSLFTQIQTYPYIGNEVHSGYLDMLLDLGIVGLIIFLFVIGALLRQAALHDRTGLVPIGVLLLHAAIDFDMSYGCYWLLLFSWVVLYSRPVDKAGGGQTGDHGASAMNAVNGLDGVNAAMGTEGVRYVKGIEGVERMKCVRGEMAEKNVAGAEGARRMYPATVPAAVKGAAALLAAAILVTAALYSWRLDAGVARREAAVGAAGAEQLAALRAALDANPYWTRIRIELAELAPPPERAALLAAGLRYEPQSVPLLRALGRVHAERRDVPQATAHLRLALRYDRYDRDNQTDAVVIMTQLAQRMRASGNEREAREAASTALSFFEAFEAQGIDAEAAGRDFEVTPESQEAANAAYLLLRQLGPGPQY